MVKLKRWAKEIVILVVILCIVFAVMDFWRKPKVLSPLLLETQQLMIGEPISLAELSEQQPVVVYFWATWCGVCKMTSPMVSDLAKSGIPVVSIAIRSGDSQRLLAGMTKAGLDFPVINDVNGQFSNAVGISATPTFMIIDKGKIASFTTGWTSEWGIKARFWLASF